MEGFPSQGERKLGFSHLYSNKPGYGRNRLWTGYHSGKAGPGPIKVYPYTNVKSTGVKDVSGTTRHRSALRTMRVSRTPQRQLSQ